MSINNRITGASSKERLPLIYDPVDRKCFDGTDYFTATKTELNEWNILKSNTSKYIPIKKDINESFENAYDMFVSRADALKKDSKNKLNLYKTGTLKKTCLSYFFQIANKKKKFVEAMTEDEVKWICNCNHGQIFYKDSAFSGEVHSYDVNSMYLSMMSSVNFKIPMKRGTFRLLTVDEFDNMRANFFEYGIYRVRIISDGSANTNKMFRFNKNNHYTSIDMNVAKKLGLEIMIVNDGRPNFLHYGSGTCDTGSRVFKDFATKLFDWRTKSKNKDCKVIASMLWGSLSEKNLKSIQYDCQKEFDFNIDSDRYDILNTSNIRADIWKIDFVEKGKYFKFAWARMKPFLLAYARQYIGRQIANHLDHIVMVNTDGFYSKIVLDIAIGTEMGCMKYEGLKNM